MSKVTESNEMGDKKSNAKGVFPHLILTLIAAVAVVCGAEDKTDIEDYTHVCQKCGKTTHYRGCCIEPRRVVEELRIGCETLRGLGLDIVLDESVLCRHCVSAEKLKLPRFATIDSCPPWKTPFRKGDRVEVVSRSSSNCDLCYVIPKSNKFWVDSRQIDAEGNILDDGVRVRIHPDMQDDARDCVNKGDKLRLLPRSSGDPVGWVPVEWSRFFIVACRMSCFKDIEYDEGEDASLLRITSHLTWVLNGRRQPMNLHDLDLLLAYKKGRKEVVFFGVGEPIDKHMPRIRALLDGAPDENNNREQPVTAPAEPL